MVTPEQPVTGGLIGRLIAASARGRYVVLGLAAAMAAWGAYSMRSGRLDAIPDLSDVQVIIFTSWPGSSPDLVEDQVTFPISTTMLAAPSVKAVRGESYFGLSFVYVIFQDGTDIYWARSRVIEYLSSVSASLPTGVTPTLGPDATGVGWVFEYALVDTSGRHDLQELRSLQDWSVRYALEAVPGVSEVASVGGFVKQFQVEVDPNALRAYRIPFARVAQAARDANGEVGGRVLEIAGFEHMVRGGSYVRQPSDLESVPLAVGPGGTPVTIGDVGEVKVGPELRRGVADLDGKGEVVGGIVVMRYGENALEVIQAVEQRLAEIRRGLPEGVELVVTYDRSGLIEASIHTLEHTLVEEMVIVSLIIFLFLLHVRSALVPILTLPLAVLLAFIPMYYQGLTINIMSLGGIAVAIGAMVDASIIMIENIHKRIEEWEQRRLPLRRLDVLVNAMQEVGPSVFFALLVITVSFMPIFTLQGTEGKLFKPLAFTKTYSMGFAAVLAVTLTPALAAIVIRGRIRTEEHNPLSRWLIAAYSPVVRLMVRYRLAVIAVALVLVAITVPVFKALESEFMPPLNEGTLLYMPTATPGISIGQATQLLQSMDRQIASFPEVDHVFGKAGRAQTATDPAPLSMIETVVTLKPESEWPPGVDWDELVRRLDQQVRYPGVTNLWWMPIQTRTEMLATGIRSQLGIKVFGPSLEGISRTAAAIAHAVTPIRGTRSAYPERTTGGFYADVHIDRAKAARYGVRLSDVNEVVASAIGGRDVAVTVEGRERYPINVRYARAFRDTPEALRRVVVDTPSGAQIPLSEMATLEFVTGPPMIRSESGQLVGFVFVDVSGRAIADYVAEAKRVVDREVKLAPGQRLEWAGQFQYLQRAAARLRVIVPITLLLVLVLLYFNTGSIIEAAIVLLAVPFSLIGAIWLLYLLGYNISVAVVVGIIALAGLDAETGVVMLLYLMIAHRHRVEEGRLRTFGDLTEVIVEGAARRIRPKLMTVATAMLGLVPILWSTGTGADVMKRIAAPMVGGLVTSFLLELAVYPAIFALWKGRGLAR